MKRISMNGRMYIDKHKAGELLSPVFLEGRIYGKDMYCMWYFNDYICTIMLLTDTRMAKGHVRKFIEIIKEVDYKSKTASKTL